MQVGIYAPYQHKEITYAAIQLANVLENATANIFVDIVAPVNQAHTGINPDWDDRVYTVVDEFYFEQGMTFDVIIWFEPPPLAEVEIFRDQGIHTVLVAPWDDLSGDYLAALETFNLVVSPSESADKLFSRYDNRNTRVIRWPAPTACSRSCVEHDIPQIIFPMFGNRLKRAAGGTLSVLEQALMDCSVDVVIPWRPAQCNSATRFEIKRIAKRFPGRVKLISDFTLFSLTALFAQSSLSVLPAATESLCWLASLSIAAGTPVICMDVSPLQEFVTRNNSVIVPTVQIDSKTGVATGEFDPNTFYKHLHGILTNPTKLRTLTANTFAITQRVSDRFKFNWLKALKCRH